MSGGLTSCPLCNCKAGHGPLERGPSAFEVDFGLGKILEAIFSTLLRPLGTLDVNFFGPLGGLCQDSYPSWKHLGKTPAYG